MHCATTQRVRMKHEGNALRGGTRLFEYGLELTVPYWDKKISRRIHD
ncbi:MAG: hypothetical protein ABR557_11250 [Pyrinomonadaceae bacterium]